MTTEELIEMAESCIAGAVGREGPKTSEEAALLASAFAQIAIAKEMASLNARLGRMSANMDFGDGLRVMSYNVDPS